MTSLTTIEPAARWHSGEVTLQRSVGVADRMAIVGPKVIRDHMPDQHRDFYAQLPFIVAGAVDAHGHVWATLLAGAPGFATSPDPRTLALSQGSVLELQRLGVWAEFVGGLLSRKGEELFCRRLPLLTGEMLTGKSDGDPGRFRRTGLLTF